MLLSILKRLQGFCRESFTGESFSGPPKYECMGSSPWGYIVICMSLVWALLLHVSWDLRMTLALSVALTLLFYCCPCYPLAISYANGFGWNIYFQGVFDGRYYNGERLFAIDWHEEKLPEKGLEFWPWNQAAPVRAADEQMMWVKRRERKEANERKEPKKKHKFAPNVLDQDSLAAAVANGLEKLGGEASVTARVKDGTSVEALATELAVEVEKLILSVPPAHHDDEYHEKAIEDVWKACKREVGRFFGNVQKMKKHKSSTSSIIVQLAP